jgi:hypothetical protein
VELLATRRLAAVLAVIGTLALPSSAQAVLLTNPQGQPVGGIWQAWANESRVPTYALPVVLTTTAQGLEAFCGSTFYPACSEPGDDPPEIALDPAFNPRWDLYHELGHIFDWTHLTDANRVRFEVLMDDTGKRWDEYTDTSGLGGASDDFAQLYSFCAEHWNQRKFWRSFWQWPFGGIDTTKADITASCRLITTLGNQTGDPGAFATGEVP